MRSRRSQAELIECALTVENPTSARHDSHMGSLANQLLCQNQDENRGGTFSGESGTQKWLPVPLCCCCISTSTAVSYGIAIMIDLIRAIACHLSAAAATETTNNSSRTSNNSSKPVFSFPPLSLRRLPCKQTTLPNTGVNNSSSGRLCCRRRQRFLSTTRET